jgi:hypothetical protein
MLLRRVANVFEYTAYHPIRPQYVECEMWNRGLRLVTCSRGVDTLSYQALKGEAEQLGLDGNKSWIFV